VRHRGVSQAPESQAALPVIGFLGASSPETSAERMRGFHLGLKEAGYVEGDNVTVLYRWAEIHMDRLPELEIQALCETLGRQPSEIR
jgi:hypothetical protein